MRTSTTSRLALCAAASIFMFPFACADFEDPLLSGPTGQVEIAVASLVYQDIMGADYRIEIWDGDTLIYQNLEVKTADYGTPDGRVLFIAPCVAGDTGPKSNQVIVELLRVYLADDTILTHGNDAYFPPEVEKTIECEENADVRADFLLTFVRRAQQGFADIVVQIQDIFCSYKVSCEVDLMADPTNYEPGPTLVTGFACTDGDATTAHKFIGFEGELCCNGSNDCTALTIGAHGAAEWSALGVGVLATKSYQGAEQILGKIFHNTTWRLDPAAIDAAGCTFSGTGFYNYGAAPVSHAYDPGGDGVSPAPAFSFSASISSDGDAITCGAPAVVVGFGL